MVEPRRIPSKLVPGSEKSPPKIKGSSSRETSKRGRIRADSQPSPPERSQVAASVSKAVSVELPFGIDPGAIGAAARQTVIDAKESGALKDVDAAVIATYIATADHLDVLTRFGFMRADGKADTTTLPTFLRYAAALGFTPEARQPRRRPGPVREGEGSSPVGGGADEAEVVVPVDKGNKLRLMQGALQRPAG